MRIGFFVSVFLLACVHVEKSVPLGPVGAGNTLTSSSDDPCSDVNLAMADEAAQDTIHAATNGDDARWQLEVQNLEGRGRLGKCMATRALPYVHGNGYGRVRSWIASHP